MGVWGTPNCNWPWISVFFWPKFFFLLMLELIVLVILFEWPTSYSGAAGGWDWLNRRMGYFNKRGLKCYGDSPHSPSFSRLNCA